MNTFKREKDVLVIMPAYNEAESIGRFLDSMSAADIPKMCDVLVINDGSADETSVIVKERGYDIISQIYNLGYGSALQTGYKYAVRKGYKYLIQIDSDGQHDVCNIVNILKAFGESEDKPDIIIGSRFFEQSVTFRISGVKKVAIKFFRMLIKHSTGQRVLDPTSGLQGLNRKAFLFYAQYGNFVQNYPDANMIIQMLLNDFTIKEIPAVMHVRASGKSMHSGLKPIMYILKMVLNTLVVIAREKYGNRKRAMVMRVD